MKPRIYRLVQASPFVLCSLLGATTALGQITPDNTLGNESSVVTPNVNVNGALADLIEGGAIRDSNLFHSFSDFNVGEFGRVYFGLPAGVANILSRVTGANVSNILGTLGVLGNANLFVINPNGIFFGPNSRLDLGGSFFGSTADSVLFEDGTVFSAKNPNDKPLLTIKIPSGLQYGSNPGSITNQSSLFQVPNVKTLGLIGGDINIPGGQLTATDGRIELGSVGSNGVVKLTPTDTSFVLDYSPVQEFQDISLSDGAVVDTSGEGGGSIQVQGANVSLRDRSFVFADTEGSQNGGGIVVEASQLSLEAGSRITTDVFGSGQGGDLTITAGELIVSDGAAVSASTLGEGDGGNLTVNASSTVQVIGTDASGEFVSSLTTETEGTGNAGDLSITTGQLIISDGAVVSTSTFGEGDAGNLTVDASEKVQVIGTSADDGFRSALLTQTFGTGNAGDLSITTDELIVSDGAEVSTSTFGERDAGNLNITTGELIVEDGAFVSADTFSEGDGGNLTVNADSKVQIIGTSADGQFGSGLFAQTNPGSIGNAGELSITTRELIVSDGAVVSAGTFGEGDGGNLTVDASSTVQVIGTDADGQFRSALLAQTVGTGNGGDISITTGQLILEDGAVVSTDTDGEGDAGNLTVDASSVQLIGNSADGNFASDLFAETVGTGNGGDISITTGELIVSDGAFVSTSTFGEGDAGNLTVDASSRVQLIGTSPDGRFRSALFAETFGTGNGGDISITTGQLIVEDGAFVSTDTFSEGDGGNLTVDASSTVQLIGNSADGNFASDLFAGTFGTGHGGDISITTGQLIVKDGAFVFTDTEGEGDGGNLTVNASSTVQVIGTDADGRFLSALRAQTVETGHGGDISITTGQLIVSDGAFVSTDTFGEGEGGNLTVDASSTVQLIGTDADGQFRSALLARTFETGNGGDISITTGELIVEDGALVSADTFGLGDGGNLTVDASSTVQLIGNSADGNFASDLFARTVGAGNGGDVSITTGELIVSDGAFVSTETFGEGEGGNLTVDASSTVQLIGNSADGRFPSALRAETEGTGNGGDVSITTGELIVSDGAVVSADTFGEGDGGNLTVDADSTVHLIGTSPSGEIRSALFAQTFGTGKAGDVSITTGELIVEDGAVVSTDTFSEGDAGNLTVNADSKVQVIGTDADGRGVTGLFTETQGTGNAGNLSITTGQLIVSDGAVVSARSFEQGSSAGDLKINANSIFLNNKGIITADTAGAQGNITLSSRDIRLLNESNITTNAQNTTGGNITIDTDTLVGLGNSDITANAEFGPGGRVEINAQGIFGLEFRDRLTPDNDITATSKLGPSFSGQVILNISQLDPTSGLTELPASLVDAEAILANDLCGFENNRIAGGSSFTITGKGGLPASADDPVINTSTTVRWRTRPGLASTRQQLQQQASVIIPQPPQEKKVIIEAQGWVIAKDGTIILTAHPFRGTPVDQILPNLDCHSGRGSRE
ncbi:MAG: filamentous hemagglutinin N-terminal domain-containing protein [Moorea sp. SIOASIH]|uniref:two-partner secretion domain-containing protein n=1 Tax=Moorena sp. SIOASIH TaxID=2607817 RepID=UPI0013B7923F|nr:filamentous hemagglutinin N-terminal domain-containing protein [Moorena sp. SIOASIH]NEO37289.1 filamentous hemagglutinin N-terminal domain-containing protein [Moorena sp. SIOASIH]